MTAVEAAVPNRSQDRLRTISRVSALALLVAVIVLMISGWGITHTGVIYKLSSGLIDRRLADAVHRATVIPTVVFFLTHVLINIKAIVANRYHSKGKLANAILIGTGAALLGIALYIEYLA